MHAAVEGAVQRQASTHIFHAIQREMQSTLGTVQRHLLPIVVANVTTKMADCPRALRTIRMGDGKEFTYSRNQWMNYMQHDKVRAVQLQLKNALCSHSAMPALFAATIPKELPQMYLDPSTFADAPGFDIDCEPQTMEEATEMNSKLVFGFVELRRQLDETQKALDDYKTDAAHSAASPAVIQVWCLLVSVGTGCSVYTLCLLSPVHCECLIACTLFISTLCVPV